MDKQTDYEWQMQKQMIEDLQRKFTRMSTQESTMFQKTLGNLNSNELLSTLFASSTKNHTTLKP